LGKDDAADVRVDLHGPAALSIPGNLLVEGDEVRGAILLSKGFPCQRQGESRVPDEEAATCNVVEWAVELEEEQVALVNRLEGPPTWTPEVHFVRLPLRKETIPLVVSHGDEELHGGTSSAAMAIPDR